MECRFDRSLELPPPRLLKTAHSGAAGLGKFACRQNKNAGPNCRKLSQIAGTNREEFSQFAGKTRGAKIAGSRNAPRPRGETLIEAVIAVSMLALVIAPASGLYVENARVTAMNRNDLVAASLADSGIEMMRNFRDTNLLKFSPNPKKCWNAQPRFGDIDKCAEKANKIAQEAAAPAGAGKNFKLVLNPETFDWDLEDGSTDFSAGLAEEYRLRLDEATAENPECGTPGADISKCSAHTNLYFIPPSGAPQLNSRGSLSRFYHGINIKYTSSGKAMKVTSAIKYMNGNSLRAIKRALILTNQPS